MYYLETKYVDLLAGRFSNFSKKRKDVWNLRCPYCGDSSKHKNKARGYFYFKKQDVLFKCHNCGVGRTLGNFLKDQATDLYDEYVMERYKAGKTGAGTVVAEPKFTFEKPKFVSKPTGLTKITDLNTSHPAVRYLQGRKLPQEALKELYYIDTWQQWVNTQVETYSKASMRYEHPRIVIPLIDKNGEWFGFQGRSLNPTDKMRYVTIMLRDDKPKLFGLHKVNYEETIYVTEGPLDSLFIRNSIAMCGADVYLDDWGISNRVWVYDNEPRNSEIVSRYASAVSRGERVVIWDPDITEKDINDMVLAGRDVQRVVECNTYQGLEAQVKLAFWKKV